MKEHASDLRGFLVISREEGARMGTLNSIQIDPATKRIAAFGYRTGRWGGEDMFVPTSAVHLVGRDVVLVDSEKAGSRVSKESPLPGTSLKTLQGSWIATMDGHHLGTLIDLDFSPADWAISELILADDRSLPVDADDLRIGDVIMVPVGYAGRVRESPKTGFLRRAFGGEALEDTKEAIRRALRIGPKEDASPTDASKAPPESK